MVYTGQSLHPGKHPHSPPLKQPPHWQPRTSLILLPVFTHFSNLKADGNDKGDESVSSPEGSWTSATSRDSLATAVVRAQRLLGVVLCLWHACRSDRLALLID